MSVGWGLRYLQDYGRFSAYVVEADIVVANGALQALMGTVDVFLVTNVLHEWDWGRGGRSRLRV